MPSVMTGLLRKKEGHNLSLGGIEAALSGIEADSGIEAEQIFLKLKGPFPLRAWKRAFFPCFIAFFLRSLQSKINKRDKECYFPRS